MYVLVRREDVLVRPPGGGRGQWKAAAVNNRNWPGPKKVVCSQWESAAANVSLGRGQRAAGVGRGQRQSAAAKKKAKKKAGRGRPQ